MLKMFHEHINFEEFTLFDYNTGVLKKISSHEFNSISQTGMIPNHVFQKETLYSTNKIILFDGPIFSTHTRFPRRIYFQITRMCNLKCDYCFIKADKNLSHVPTQDIMKIANYMGKHGLIEVRLTGGEPTIHPDFFAIIQAFQQNNIYVSIATNGLWSTQTLTRLANLENVWIICSLDGDQISHNKYRPKTFEKIVTNLAILKQTNPRLRLRLTTVLTKENKKDIFALGKLGKDLQVESITAIPLRPQVRKEKIKDQMLTSLDFKEAIQDMLITQEKLGVRFTTTLETQYKNKIHPDPIFRKKFSCAAGREGTNLDYNATTEEFVVYACAYSPAVDFDLMEEIRRPFVAGKFKINELEKFKEIWDNEQAWEIYRNLETKYYECQSCQYYKDNSCTGSCPIQNIDFNSFNIKTDMLMQLKDKLAKTAEWYCYKNFL